MGGAGSAWLPGWHRFGASSSRRSALHGGIDRDRPHTGDRELRWRQAAELLLFASCAEGVAARLLASGQGVGAPVVALSPREREVLLWTMEGKTAWEIGRILAISEQTVVRHLAHAVHKLDCVNKVQAVSKALRLGLIC